jgi:uncharacterized MAPEG superfamily protein
VIALTAVFWVPYILNTIMVRGLIDAVGYPADPKPIAPWAMRAKAAHYNAVENLVLFAALVLILNTIGISNETTVMACKVYFWARLVHYLVYTAGIPWVRTLSFTVGWLCIVALLVQLI